MEQWLKDAKKLAQSEAKYIVDSMKDMAIEHDLEAEWFIEEVVKNIHKIKDNCNE